MGTVTFRVPTEEEKEILRRNKIDPEGVSVSFRSENTIHILRHTTRDTIVIHKGDKPW